MGLELGEGVFDWIEIRIGRQEQEACAGSLDQAAHLRSLVGAEIVHHHNVARRELRNEHLLDMGFEGDEVDGAIEHHRRDHAGAAQPSDEGGGFPVAMRNECPQALTRPAAAMTRGHVGGGLGGGPGFVDEDERVGIQIVLGREPVPVPLQDVGPLLLGHMGGLFCA